MSGSADPLTFMELQGILFYEEQMRKSMASRNNPTIAMFPNEMEITSLIIKAQTNKTRIQVTIQKVMK